MAEQSNVINFRKSKPAPAVQLPLIVWVVVGLIIAIYGGLELAGPKAQTLAVYDFAFIPARFGPAPFEQAIGAKWWSMLTYGFLHASWSHVLLNSLWLAIFSKPVQAHFGNLRYLLILATGIIAGAVITLLVHWGDPLILVGISAGVSALLAASIPLFYGRGRVLRPLELITNRSALMFSLVWLVMTFFTGASQYISNTFVPATNIAWEAHLGGFFAGLILFYLLEAARTNTVRPTLH
ncbi:MAG: rhomboid family intramembrane serine protease [Aestuariivirga sp.]